MTEDNIAGLKNLLHENEEVIVDFTKSNGTARRMRCTLMTGVIPAASEPKEGSTYTPNPEVQPVWDLDAQGWRSFRFDTVNTIEMGGVVLTPN